MTERRDEGVPPAGAPADPAVARESAATPAAPANAPAAPTGPAKPAPPKPAAGAGTAAAKPAAKPDPKAVVPPGPPDPPPPADLEKPPWLLALESAMPGVGTVSYWVGDWTVIVPVERLIDVLTFLRDAQEARFTFCSDVTAVDWPTRAERFDVAYFLYSIPYRHRARVKTRVADGQAVPTSTGIWPATNWLEREIYDMFGITFSGHPDPRRILMPDEWQGHPQRKDYPLEGPGELVLESPQEWLKLQNDAREADFE